MKKTLIALMALAGLAGAETASLTQENASGWVVATGSGTSNWTMDGLTVSTDTEGDIIFTGDIATRVSLTNTRTVTVIAFTLDLSKISTPTGTAAQVLTLTGGSHTTGVGINASGNLTGTWDSNYTYYDSGASLLGTNQQSFVYVLGTGDGTQAAGGTQIYTNSDTVWSKSGLKGDIGDITTLKMESWIAEGLVSMTVWSGQEAYSNKDLVASAFNANANLIIPEPTTATLSLLALAGLAARRRRR